MAQQCSTLPVFSQQFLVKRCCTCHWFPPNHLLTHRLPPGCIGLFYPIWCLRHSANRLVLLTRLTIQSHIVGARKGLDACRVSITDRLSFEQLFAITCDRQVWMMLVLKWPIIYNAIYIYLFIIWMLHRPWIRSNCLEFDGIFNSACSSTGSRQGWKEHISNVYPLVNKHHYWKSWKITILNHFQR